MPVNEEDSESEIYDEDDIEEELWTLAWSNPVLIELWNNEKDAEYDRI